MGSTSRRKIRKWRDACSCRVSLTPDVCSEHKDALPLGEVDPVVMSEVLGTLGVLASKGK